MPLLVKEVAVASVGSTTAALLLMVRALKGVALPPPMVCCAPAPLNVTALLLWVKAPLLIQLPLTVTPALLAGCSVPLAPMTTFLNDEPLEGWKAPA